MEETHEYANKLGKRGRKNPPKFSINHERFSRTIEKKSKMKSTKVQTLGAMCTAYLASSFVYYANARARKLAMPRVRVSCNVWCCQFLLQRGLETSVGIILGKAEC